MYSPAGFRRPRGMGDTPDYRALANQYPKGSAMYQFWSNLAQNPSNVSQQQIQASLAMEQQNPPSPYYQLTTPAGAAYNVAPNVNLQDFPVGSKVQQIAPGALPPATVAAIAQAAQPTPTPAPAARPVRSRQFVVRPQQPAAPPVKTPVMVQPANAPSPVDTTPPTSVGFFSTTILGIPLWLWGAGIGAYFVFGYQGGRYGG